jgi:hypothetical protein
MFCPGARIGYRKVLPRGSHRVPTWVPKATSNARWPKATGPPRELEVREHEAPLIIYTPLAAKAEGLQDEITNPYAGPGLV